MEPQGAPGSTILDLGCGHRIPISQVLAEEGFTAYGVDASPKLIAAFRRRFPGSLRRCAAVEDSKFFGRTFDGVIAWGSIILLSPENHPVRIHKVAGAINPGGKFRFTVPQQAVRWQDALTCGEGLVVDGEQNDEADNHYYLASKL